MSLVGKKAPGFTLVSDETKEVSLDSFKGKKLVIHFFPLSFTDVCENQMCTTRDGIEDFKNDHTDVIAISVDSPFVLAEFKKKNNLNFTLLSDYNKEVAPTYGALYEEFVVLGLKKVAKRAVFVLDEEQNVIHEEIMEDVLQLPDFDKVRTALS